MLDVGTDAPGFELPALVEGEIGDVSLSEYSDSNIVVLAFYPMDFSPICTEEVCSLRDLELFGIHRDVSLLGISGDSVYSHEAFAEQYRLQFPLLSDCAGTVAEQYGVLHEEILGHERLPKRSVFVIGGRGRIQYAWSTDDPSQLPDLDELRDAVESIGDDYTAVERYRNAHDHYQYGVSELETASEAFEAEEWTLARGAFDEASWYLETAAQGFDSAATFAESKSVVEEATTAAETTRHVGNAANWFAKAAKYYAEDERELATEYHTEARDQIALADDEPELTIPEELETVVGE